MQKIKISTSFSVLSAYIYVLLSLPLLQCCQYSEYEEALLPLKSPYDVFEISLDDRDEFEFGFWSLCVPQQTFQNIPWIDQEYNTKQSEDGQLLFLIKGKFEYTVIGFVSMSLQLEKVQHKIIIKGSQVSILDFTYEPMVYEGKWILNVFTFNFIESKIYVEMTNQLRQSSNLGSKDLYKQIIQGGRGLISNLNLNIFKGRLSYILIGTIIQIQIESLFQYMNLYCQVPRPLKEEQTIYLVKELKIFDGDNSLNFMINHYGTRYCLSGWIKYDAARVIEKSIYPLIRISLFKNYFSQTYYGDELFSLKVHLNKIEPKICYIEILYDFHILPIIGKLQGPLINSNPIQFYDQNSNDYFEGLQQWHYLYYEQGATFQHNTLLYLQFFNELNLLKKEFYLNPTGNSAFYLYLGADEFVADLLQASLYDVKFQYNYLSDKQFFFDACHYSCKTCDGPLENNCLDCEINTNRHYLAEQKQCKCNHGFMGIIDEKVCLEFLQEYSSIDLREEYQSDHQQCEFGYFLYPQNDKSFECIKCPQSNFYDYFCVDCIYYPLIWYLKPICRYDLISEKQSAYDAFQYLKRDSFNYDFYLIDHGNQIQLHSGFMDFCDVEADVSCFKAKYQHLGKDIYVKCKPNYYFEDGDCILTNINCLQATSNGGCLQTKVGMYQNNGIFYQCPFNCLNCEFYHDQKKLQCKSCIDGYAIDNGDCVPCGNFCSFCQKYNDERQNMEYLKCYKCIDDSKFFLSFDGVNCFENNIKYCLYAFQALSNDYQINTLDLYFTPRNDWHNIITTCGRCSYSYTLIVENQVCFIQPDEQCFFLYADKFCDPPYLDIEYLYILQQEYYTKTSSGDLISMAIDLENFNVYCTSIQYCMIRHEYDQDERFKIVQFNLQCPGYVENCETCLREKVALAGVVYICLICKQGYYADRISGKCFPCPSGLNCQYCTQQQKLSKDSWKNYIRAFYQLFINSNNDHPFKLFAQSENKEDYEIVCTFCIKGYEIVQGICIKKCAETCLECQYQNGQNQCIRCQLELQGRKLSLSDNQCIECPQNCALCRVRQKDEIQLINPLFNNEKYISTTYQCLKSFDNQEYFFDQELGSFVDCLKFNNCEKQFIIPINLYCSQQDFAMALNAEKSSNEKNQFKIKNILFDNLISGSSFNEFENDQFYSSANSNLIKTIVLNIVSIKPQTCKIAGNATIQQVFGQNIFSTINVELSINFNQNTIIEYEKTITFLNFNKVTIFGGKFVPVQTNYLKQLIFSSIFSQTITIDTFIYEQLSQNDDQSLIIFDKVKQLTLINFKIINLKQNNIEKFILITDTTFRKIIKLQGFQILNSTIKNQKTIFFQIHSEDIIEINDLLVKGKFQNTTLIETSPQNKGGNLFLKNMQIKVDLLNCIPFLNWIYFNQIIIAVFQFENSYIQNSIIILINNNFNFSYLKIKDSKFGELGQGIINSNQLVDESFQMEFYNILLEHIEYHQTTKLINLNKYSYLNSTILFDNITISNNYITSIQFGFNLNAQSICLIYISLDSVQIQHLTINRGFGLKDISINNAKFLRIMSSQITQNNEFKFLGLHQYLDCQLQEVKGELYLQSLFITAINDFQMSDIKITYVQSYNSPIIYYKSSDTITQQQLETIQLSNIFIESNLLLLTNSSYQTAIIFIESIQQTILEISNITFIGNILHEYVQNNLQISSLLLNFNCIYGKITITNSYFSKNAVYNSTNNIIYIKSQHLNLINNTFYQNSYFNYQIIQPFLLWGFKDSEELSYQQINNIFQVKSKSGVGQFLIENLEIKFCHFEQSVGFQGGSLYIEPQKNSKITVSQTQFKNISTTFSKDLGFGGAIYIDGQASDSLYLQIFQLIINDIKAKEGGGFIYLKSDCPIILISIYQLNIKNIYSKLGSFIYLVLSAVSFTSQQVKIDSIVIKNEKEEFSNFLNLYTQLSNLDQLALINDRVLIYFNSAINLMIQNIEIDQIILESIMVVENAQRVSVSNLKITNSLINQRLLSLHPNLYQSNKIQIKNVEIYKVTIAIQLQSNNCEQKFINERIEYFQCISNDENKKAPLILLNQSGDQKYSYGDCILNQVQQQLELEESLNIEDSYSGGFLFFDLTEQTYIKLSNLIFQKINCKFCLNGLIFYSFKKIKGFLEKQQISNLKVSNSTCGKYGCLEIRKENEAQLRLLTSSDINIQQINLEVIIDNYICQYNNAKNGTCLYLDNIKALIQNSIFQYNNASELGGAIVVKMKQDILIKSSLISNNSAKKGGGIYLIDQQDMDYYRLQTYINNNQAQIFGENIISVPQQLTISFQNENSRLPTIEILRTQDLLIQQVLLPQNDTFPQMYYYLPSGQQISVYQRFSIKDRTYSLDNQKFRVIALSKDNSIIKNLKNSFCFIDSRMLNKSEIDDEKSEFSNNFTNKNIVNFNELTYDYNLDDMIVYFDSDLPDDIVLQLQFRCSSVFVPNYNKQYPYNLLSTHSNYKLRMNFKTYPCQIGEIKNYTDFSCIPCDSNQGLYSLNINQQKCELKDDMSTISVKSALLNLKFGYWRPYFQSNQVSYCLNLPGNCLGGWLEGHASCFLGHIGALCEQCDLYNIRGDGKFSISKKFSCGLCTENVQNVIIITMVSIWTLASILISVQSTLKAIKEFFKNFCLSNMGLAISQNINQSAILIKMLTNYLQIIASIATFQLKLPNGLESTFSTMGSPIQATTYSLDCFLSKTFEIEIQYARIIWQIIMPSIYIAFFFKWYLILILKKRTTFNKCVITTTFIYMYIYLQPSIIGGLVQLISYREISGYKWIQSNISQRYDTIQHGKWMLRFCLPLLFIFTIFIPVYFLIALLRNSSNLNKKMVRLEFGYLYNEYTGSAYFWEIIKIAQKGLMIIFLTYFEDNIVIKATIVLLITGVYLELNQKYKPYKLNALNQLDCYSTNVCIASIVLAIGIYVAQQSNSLEIQIPYQIIILILNLHIIYLLISKIVVEYLNEKTTNCQDTLDQLRYAIRKQFPSLIKIRFMRKILADRNQQRIRTRNLYLKLKNFLIPQAKEILELKRQQNRLTIERNLDSNINTNHLSLRSPNLIREGQQLIRNPVLENSLNFSKQNATSYVFEKLKQQKNHQTGTAFDGNQQNSPTNAPILIDQNFNHGNQEDK